MKYIAPFLITMTMAAARASEVAHGSDAAHEAIHVPVKLITYQSINVAIMIIALIYFLRGGVKKFFADKKASFMSAAQRADAARKAAEQEHMQIQVRLSKLDSTADESIARARAEAADMKKQLIAEAEALSQRIREEAQQAAGLEIEKARIRLREGLIRDSVEAARGQLESKVSAEDQKRLQSDFIQNIQAVQK